ncbi:MAG: RibD family protein [Leptolyngbyaceae cyanobacterium]
MNSSRSQITVVLAMSADGKIADYRRTAARFSSTNDLQHLEAQVARADAVLFGAGTLRAYGTCLSVRQPELLAQRSVSQQPPQPVQIVCSQTGNLATNLRFFRQSVPRWLLTSPTGAAHWQGLEAKRGDRSLFHRILPELTATPDWQQLLGRLKQLGLHRIALLGGGTLVASLAEQGVIDELYLTICPLLVGGSQSPTPFDGQGLSVTAAVPLRLVDVVTQGDEVFLHYRRCHHSGD